MCGTKGFLACRNLVLDLSLVISELEGNKQRAQVHSDCPSWLSFFKVNVLWLENADVSNLKHLTRKGRFQSIFHLKKKQGSKA